MESPISRRTNWELVCLSVMETGCKPIHRTFVTCILLRIPAFLDSTGEFVGGTPSFETKKASARARPMGLAGNAIWNAWVLHVRGADPPGTIRIEVPGK